MWTDAVSTTFESVARYPVRESLRQHRQFGFVLALVALYALTFLVADGLQFEIRKDEQYFWPASLHFSGGFPPTLEKLRGYDVVSTPLSFIVWGQIERLTGGGIFAGRLLNLSLSFVMACLIGVRIRTDNPHTRLAAAGLLTFPYYLALSCHLYTDVLAAFFVLFGMWFYERRRTTLAVVSMVLAISTRQYMIAFPLALAASEFTSVVRGDRQRWVTAVAMLGAAGSMLLWFWIFRGFAPAQGIAEWIPRYPDPMMHIANVVPEYGLYFLTCLAVYFVLPEFVLFRRWREWDLGQQLNARSGVLAVGLAVLFFLFPPRFVDHPMGLFNRVAVMVLPGEMLRMAVFYALALCTCLRFTGRLDTAFWVVLLQGLVMLKSQLAWERYFLPSLAILWYLRSIRAPKKTLAHPILRASSRQTRRVPRVDSPTWVDRPPIAARGSGGTDGDAVRS